MLFPEFRRSNVEGMAPSISFLYGIPRRIFLGNKPKIFVIGFHKTGTTSLAKALATLGYRVCGYMRGKQEFDPDIHTRKDLLEMSRSQLENYDAFEDTPWFMLYRELLDRYPDGKYILTVRSADSWYNSVKNHFGGYDKWNYHPWIYDGFGDPIGNRELYLRKYEQHNREVKEYFNKKGKELLIMELPHDFNWEILCNFLDCKKPFKRFPHANSVSSRNTWKRKLLDKIKESYYKV